MMVYPDGSTFPPYWVGAPGDVYGKGCSFSYGTTFAPNTVFGDNCTFLGNTCTYCWPYITFLGPVVIGKNCTFYYCILVDTVPQSVIGQPLIDTGSNSLGSATMPRPNHTKGGGHHIRTKGCAQTLAPGGEKKPPCVHDS